MGYLYFFSLFVPAVPHGDKKSKYIYGFRSAFIFTAKLCFKYLVDFQNICRAFHAFFLTISSYLGSQSEKSHSSPLINIHSSIPPNLSSQSILPIHPPNPSSQPILPIHPPIIYPSIRAALKNSNILPFLQA